MESKKKQKKKKNTKKNKQKKQTKFATEIKNGDTNLSNSSNLCEDVNALKLYKYLFKVKTTLSACPNKVFCVSRLGPPDVNTTPK